MEDVIELEELSEDITTQQKLFGNYQTKYLEKSGKPKKERQAKC